MSELRVGPEDGGRSIELTARDRLAIALPETAGTGYQWTVEELPRGARVVEERYERAAHAPLGSASLHVLVLQSPAGGTVRLRLARSWRAEGDGENEQGDDEERYELTIVQPDA